MSNVTSYSMMTREAEESMLHFHRPVEVLNARLNFAVVVVVLVVSVDFLRIVHHFFVLII